MPADRPALLISSYHPIVGGGESHARLLCAEWRRQGAAPVVVTRRRAPETPAFEMLDGSPVHRVPPAGLPRLGKYLMIPGALRRLLALRGQIDLIYVCGLRVLGLAGLHAARRLGVPCVLRAESRGEFSGEFIWTRPDGRLFPVARALWRGPVAWRNRRLRQADAFLAISADIAGEFRAGGVPEAKLTRIPNGLDTDRFAPGDPAARPALRARLGLPVDAPLLAYSGKLNRGKGLERLLRVWAALAPAHPAARLVLVGGGGGQALSCEADLRAQARRDGLADSVIFTGYRADVPDWLRAADGFVFPSENEAFGLSVAEALACGLPVVASRTGGIPDVVRDGLTGRLVAVTDDAAWRAALTELLDDPAGARARWGATARADVVARFGIAAVARRHLELFRRLRAGGAAETAP